MNGTHSKFRKYNEQQSVGYWEHSELCEYVEQQSVLNIESSQNCVSTLSNSQSSALRALNIV